MAKKDVGGPTRDDCNDLSAAEDFELTVTRAGTVTTLNDFSKDGQKRPLNIAVDWL